MSDKRGPIVLVVLDGWGFREEENHNALTRKHAPYFYSLFDTYPHSLLTAHGTAIGLPEGQIGTSEVGHMTIGAGRPIDTDLVRISKAFATGAIEKNPEFLALVDHVKKYDSTLHIMGLTSPGGIHSHHDHLFNLLRLAKKYGVTKIAVHAFTDGRDVAPQSARSYLTELEQLLEELGIGKIVSVSGRYFAMDRDNNWDRIKKVEDVLFHGKAHEHKGTIEQLFTKVYETISIDEHVEPVVILDDKGKATTMEQNDGVFFFNFRPDRARQISKIISEQADAKNIFFATMTEYDPDIRSRVFFPPPEKQTTLAAEIAHAGMSQIHIAETEKYAHATYFLNGKVEEPHRGEEFVLIESRKDIRTHDEAPEMRAHEITDAALEALKRTTDFIFINYANADMVAHTANEDATIQAIHVLDAELKRLVEATSDVHGIVCITSDHGNAEVTVHPETGEKHTAHTLYPVPLIVTDKAHYLEATGTLADVAPTVLSLLSLEVPDSMTGHSLLQKAE